MQSAGSSNGDVRRLHGSGELWRLRVGDWRVRFHRDDSDRVISVLAVRPRGSAYQP
jgi:mRNA interferase RelE/StbE